MKQGKSHNSSGARFIQRVENQNPIDQPSRDFHNRTQSGGQKQNFQLPQFQQQQARTNQSFDFAYNTINHPSQIEQHQQRFKSYSQNENNILDDLNDDNNTENLNINITLGKTASNSSNYNNCLDQEYALNRTSTSDELLQQELQKILSKTITGEQSIIIQVDELTYLISAIESCMIEAQETIMAKDQDVFIQKIFLKLQNLKKELNKKDQILHQQRSTILSLQNEISEQKHMVQLNHPSQSPTNINMDDMQMRLIQLEQENEMLQIENKQAIKLAVQGRNKKGEKELGELITRLKNDKVTVTKNLQNTNYSSLLNAQYNKNTTHERKNSAKGNGNKSFNLF